MALESYDLCPGGTGKKIKFCGCKDIIHDLDKAVAAIEGDQRAAAITLLDRLLEKHPERACLLALKVGCQFAVDDFEAAEPTVARFISQHPDNPLALSQSAILHAFEADMDNAVSKVQRALELCDDSLPYTVHEAINIIGRMFVQRGDILAARAHLLAHAAYSDEGDTRSASMLMRLLQHPDIPVLLKEDLALVEELPQDVTWRGKFDEAIQFAERGAWLAAVERLRQIAEQHPGEAAVMKNIAIFCSWLGRRDEAVAAWHAYAQLDGLALDDAVEAEAIAQLLTEPSEVDLIDLMQITYAIRDIDRLTELLASDRRFELMPSDPENVQEEDQPPPRGLYLWLDRPQVSSGDEATADDVPRISGRIAVFGRQTDREARLELILLDGAPPEQASRELCDQLGDVIDAAGDHELFKRESRAANESNARFRFPPEMSRPRRLELLAEQQRHFVFSIWPKLATSALDGKSPLDVAGEPAHRVHLLAATLIVELSSSINGLLKIDYNKLREKLGLPRREKIDPWTMSQVSQCPMVRVPLIDVLKLGDEDLATLYMRAVRVGARDAVRHVAMEMVGRSSLNDKIDRVELHEVLASVTIDNAEALSYIQKARELAVAQGNSGARWLLLELDMRLERGEPTGVQELLTTIERKYIKEPGIGQALVQILVKYGLIHPDGTPAGMPPQSPAVGAGGEDSATDAAGKLWTPESEAASSSPEGESKLWLPGME